MHHQCGKCKLLRLKRDKVDNTLHVSLPSQPATLTKRGILADLAKVYDPLGLVSPAMLEGKQIYQEASEMRLSWDAPQTKGIAKRWLKWEKNAPDVFVFVCCFGRHYECSRANVNDCEEK